MRRSGKLQAILDRPLLELLEHARLELVVSRQSAYVTTVRERVVTTRYDPFTALQPHLTSEQLATAETIYRLWNEVTPASRPLIGTYEAASTGRRGIEPDLSDHEAEQHLRLSRALKAMGGAWSAVVDTLCYGAREHPAAAIAKALDAARPFLIGEDR